jgi:hypothetical protein
MICPANVPQLDRMCISSTAVELRRRCLSALARGRGAAPAGRVVPAAESPIATDPAGASLPRACMRPSFAQIDDTLNPVNGSEIVGGGNGRSGVACGSAILHHCCSPSRTLIEIYFGFF